MNLTTRRPLAACVGFLFSAAGIVLLIFFQQSIADDLGVPLAQFRARPGPVHVWHFVLRRSMMMPNP